MTKKEALVVLGCNKNDEELGYYDMTGLYHDCLETLIQCGLFGFCACGIPAYVLRGFRNALRCQQEQKLADNEMQIYLYILNKYEYLDHGSSIFCSCLTEKGIALLTLLNAWYEEEVFEDEK